MPEQNDVKFTWATGEKTVDWPRTLREFEHRQHPAADAYDDLPLVPASWIWAGIVAISFLAGFVGYIVSR